MSLISRSGSIVAGTFGARLSTAPARAAPAVTVTQAFQDGQTFLAVAIDTAVSGATSYSATFVNAATGADLGTAHFVAPGGVLSVPNVATTTKLIYEVQAHPGGMGLRAEYDQTPVTAIAVVDPAVLSATYANDPFVITHATWTVTPSALSYVIQEDADGVGAGTPLDPTPVLVPSGGATKFYRVVETATGPLGDTATSTSAYVGPILAAPGGTLFKLTTANVTLGDSVYWPAGQTTSFKPTITLTGIPVGNTVQWAASSPISYPVPLEEHWKNLEVYAGDLVPVYATLATDATTRPPNFALWRADPDDPDLVGHLRFRQVDGLGGKSQATDTTWNIAIPDAVPPDPAALVSRQLLRRSSAQIPGVAVPDNPELYGGIVMGDGQQFFPSMAFSANGAKVLALQDCAQPMMSLNSGRKWFRPRSLGLKLLMGRGVANDPVNNSRWLGLFTAAFQANKQSLSGLYISNNDSDSWSLIKTVPNMGNPQATADNITCYPAAGGSSAKWYFAVNGDKTAAAWFCKSGADNGATWGALTSLAWATFGRIYGLKASPHTPNRLLMFAERGLSLSTNDGASWAPYPGNLPAGAVRSGWIDPLSASHMLVVVASLDTGIQGVYETNNATAGTPTWTRIRACPAHWLAVGALSGGARTLYVKCGSTGGGTTTANNTDHVRLRSGTWITRATTAPNRINLNLAGAQSNIQPFTGMCILYTVMLGGGQHVSNVVSHPTNPDLFLVHGDTSFLLTTDSGLNVNVSMTGYGGLGVRSAHYDLASKNRITFGCQDVDPGFSNNGGKSLTTSAMHGFEERVEKVMGAGINSFHGWAIVRVPNDVAEVEYRGRIIVGAGPSNIATGCMGFLDENGSWGDWMGAATAGQSNAAGGGSGGRQAAGYLRHNHNKIWCGANVWNLASSGVPGLSPSGRVILGEAMDGTDTIYGWNEGTTLYRATSWGGAWSTLGTLTIAKANGRPIGAVSRYDGRRQFWRTASRAFTMIFDNAGTMETTVFDLQGDTAGGSLIFDTPYESDATISAIAGDDLDERYIYLATDTMGVEKRVYRGKFNAGFTAITWENVTPLGLPCGAPSYQLFPAGLSGGVHASSKDMGNFIVPTPADWAPRVGAWKFSGQPSNGQTLSINGQTFTFRTSGATGLEANIGASLSATLTAAAAAMNASAHASVTPCTYTARYGTRIEATMDAPPQGIDATFPLTAGTTANATLINAATPCKDYVWINCPLPIH